MSNSSAQQPGGPPADSLADNLTAAFDLYLSTRLGGPAPNANAAPVREGPAARLHMFADMMFLAAENMCRRGPDGEALLPPGFDLPWFAKTWEEWKQSPERARVRAASARTGEPTPAAPAVPVPSVSQRPPEKGGAAAARPSSSSNKRVWQPESFAAAADADEPRPEKRRRTQPDPDCDGPSVEPPPGGPKDLPSVAAFLGLLDAHGNWL